jgi:hypothetical protein
MYLREEEAVKVGRGGAAGGAGHCSNCAPEQYRRISIVCVTRTVVTGVEL